MMGESSQRVAQELALDVATERGVLSAGSGWPPVLVCGCWRWRPRRPRLPERWTATRASARPLWAADARHVGRGVAGVGG
jgi:hypothetical protein